jgi:acetyl esterase/lipase
MGHSLTYHLTLLVIKLKGLKKNFSQDPIDVKKVRKDDVHNPPLYLRTKYHVSDLVVARTTVTQLSRIATGVKQASNNKLTIYIHGGAFVSGPTVHNWDVIGEILKQTEDQDVWMCDYPKAPETKIVETSSNIDQVYSKALETYQANQISLVGDSVGATLIAALVQRLVQKSAALVPRKIILVSPVMDSTMSNPAIDDVDKIDPILSKAGVLSAKKMSADGGDLCNPMISPLYGSFEKFPATVFFIATNDIMYPDQVLAVEKLASAKTDLTVIEGEGMPHIWPILPVMKEAKVALGQLIEHLKQ